MEAARVAAERGHRVKLYERSGRLGGQMYAYARVAGYPHLMGHVEWLESELRRLGVGLILHSDVGPRWGARGSTGRGHPGDRRPRYAPARGKGPSSLHWH